MGRSEAVGHADGVATAIQHGVIRIVINLLIEHVIHTGSNQQVFFVVLAHTDINLSVGRRTLGH